MLRRARCSQSCNAGIAPVLLEQHTLVHGSVQVCDVVLQDHQCPLQRLQLVLPQLCALVPVFGALAATLREVRDVKLLILQYCCSKHQLFPCRCDVRFQSFHLTLKGANILLVLLQDVLQASRLCATCCRRRAPFLVQCLFLCHKFRQEILQCLQDAMRVELVVGVLGVHLQEGCDGLLLAASESQPVSDCSEVLQREKHCRFRRLQRLDGVCEGGVGLLQIRRVGHVLFFVLLTLRFHRSQLCCRFLLFVQQMAKLHLLRVRGGRLVFDFRRQQEDLVFLCDDRLRPLRRCRLAETSKSIVGGVLLATLLRDLSRESL
mmetsp:Transcript_13421/g.37117  ORF Transcript_13421/g.37117 Transcript_13421/m.37117 type:complete len:319 (+) Transcript_13421:1237-2193(+)